VVPEAQLEQAAEGLVAKTDGWFVLNARDARWYHAEGRSAFCDFEGEIDFAQVGVNVSVLGPGQPMAMYHWEADQEDFLVVAGEAVLLVEGEERPLGAWDFVHCPSGTKHTTVGAREHADDPDWGSYPVDDAAARHGASVTEETSEPPKAYAHLTRRQPARYRDDWLPGDPASSSS
jgi:quercetin dioxygenase-like cupin family protein